jgi:hypothetical protein
MARVQKRGRRNKLVEAPFGEKWMMRKFCRYLGGAALLILTIIWSGLVQSASPDLSFDTTAAAASFQKNMSVDPLSSSQSALRRSYHQGVLASTITLHVSDRKLLAETSFSDGGRIGDAHANFNAPGWLGNPLQQLEGKADPDKGSGRRSVSEPLSLFLLGTGMFCLAAFRKKRRSRAP